MNNFVSKVFHWDGRDAVIAILVLVALLSSNCWIGYRNLDEIRRHDEWVAHTYAVLHGLTDVLSAAQDIETGQRGYTIANNDTFLEPFHGALASLDKRVKRLLTLTSDNPQQQERVQTLAKELEKHVKFHTSVVAFARTGDLAGARQMVISGRGKAGMDAIRRMVDDMRISQDGLLKERASRADHSFASAVRSIVFSVVTGVVLSLAAGMLIKRIARIRRQAAQELYEQKERYRTTLTSIGDGVVSTDARGKVIFMNAVAEQLTAWPAADATGQPITSVLKTVQEKTREPTPNPVALVLATGNAAELANHTLLIARDGVERPIDDSATPVRDQLGTLTGAVMVFRDVSGRRQSEEKLREAEERFRQTAVMTGEWIWEQEPSGRYIYSSEAVKEIIGFEPQEVVGKHYSELFSDFDNTPDRAHLPLTSSKEQYFRVLRNYRHRSGEVVMVESTGMPILDSDGRVTKWRGVDRNVTEQKRAEENLRVLVENARIAILMVGKEGRITFVNSQTEQLFGYARSELIGQVVEMLIPERYRTRHPVLRREFFDAASARPMGVGTRLYALKKDGQEFPVEVGLAPVCSGGQALVVTTVFDMTEVRQMETALREADSRKDEFLAMLAHELRSPIAPIRNAAHIINQSGPHGENVRWGIEVIQRQVTHLARLIDDLVDVARVSRGKISLHRERVLLGNVVQSAVETVKSGVQKKNQKLNVQQPAEDIYVFWDSSRLSQVILNLLNNAVKFTPAGGEIDLRIARLEKQAEVRVRDSGIGMSRELKTRAFDLFAQGDTSLHREESGLGIGLTLCKQIVELHGGRIEAKSEGEGRGSEFIVTIPLDTEISNLPPPTETQRPQTTGMVAKRILLADDNQDSADSLSALLEMEGHLTRTVYDGEHVTSAAAEFAPEVIILDIGLPGRDGYKLASDLRANPPTAEALLIACTGYATPEARQRAIAAGFDHHLVKPVDVSVVLTLCNAPRGARQR
jgi:PAS domain S-box-containing protein